MWTKTEYEEKTTGKRTNRFSNNSICTSQSWFVKSSTPIIKLAFVWTVAATISGTDTGKRTPFKDEIMDADKLVIVWSLYFSMYNAVVTAVYNYTSEKELRTLLFTTNEYDRFIPPDTNVTVYASVELYTMNKLDIKDESMEISTYIGLIWYDPRLQWFDNPSYSKIQNIRSNNENIWVPRIAVANSVSDLSVIGDKNMMIIIHISGTVMWTVGKIDKTHCDCDVTYYPFDTQHCGLTLIVIGYTTEEVKLDFHSTAIGTTFFSENGEWDFLGSYGIKEDRYLSNKTLVRQLQFMLKFRRRPLFQFMNSLLPVTMLSVLTSLIFKVPAESGEKIGFCLTVLLAFAVYVTIVSNHIPTTSLNTAYLSIYLIVILVFGIVSVFVTIFVLYCHSNVEEKPIPSWLKKIASHVLIPMTCARNGSCCSHRKRKIKNHNKDENLQDSDTKTTVELDISWKELGQIIDSFSFSASLLINFIMGLVIYSLFIYGYVCV